MPMQPELKIDWASITAARYACRHWHYSKTLPVGKLVKFGVWEDTQFIGVVLFSRGANRNMLKPYGLEQTQGCELTRIALADHKTPVSRILSICTRLLKRNFAGLRLVVSYADTNQGHTGGIYQASNWIYDYESSQDEMVINGKKIHRKSAFSKYGTSSVEKLKALGLNARFVKGGGGKHRYLLALDKAMLKLIQPLGMPYPKRDKQAMADHSHSTAAEHHRPSRSILTLASVNV